MKSSDGKKYVYEKAQLIEVICQLRFPPILSIETTTPADFQDTIRESFPRYMMQTEQPQAPGAAQPPVKVHTFVSADGAYKLCLSSGSISLSTLRYTSWEDFAGWLDEPLGQFIRIYKPAFFERVGLRFVNAFSKEALELTDRRWNDLIQSRYLGILDDDDIDEASVTKCSTDVEMKLDGGMNLRIHAGPGMIKRMVRTGNAVQSVPSGGLRFILDTDVFIGGNVRLESSADVLDGIHEHSDRVFSEAITDVLHEAMEPTFVV